MTRITGTLHEDVCTFIIAFRWSLLRMRNVSDKVVEKIKPHVLCSVSFSETRAICDIISAFTRQQWVCDRARIVRCVYPTCLFVKIIIILYTSVITSCIIAVFMINKNIK
jgi:hypothetical protein